MKYISKKIKFLLVLLLMFVAFLFLIFLNKVIFIPDKDLEIKNIQEEGVVEGNREEVKNDQKGKIIKENKIENVNEFHYNYQDIEFVEKEKQVLEIGKKEAIKFLGEEGYYEEIPFKVKREKFGENYDSFLKDLNLSNNDYVWYFSGSLYCSEKEILERKRDKNCVGGVIEVIISDKDLKVLKVFHSK